MCGRINCVGLRKMHRIHFPFKVGNCTLALILRRGDLRLDFCLCGIVPLAQSLIASTPNRLLPETGDHTASPELGQCRQP